MAPLTCAALLLIGLATSTVAGPVNSRFNANNECASFCPENTKFGFENGKTYEYAYESEVKTHIPGASTGHSSLHMNALVKLEVLSRCEMALVLENVVLDDVSPESGRRAHVTGNRQFASALERSPLRFAFVSGHIDSLCPATREETWVLNLKRGILSNFQNNMNDFDTDFRLRETDVSGECPVTYTTHGSGWGGVYTINKTKNIEACQNRLSADTIYQGTAYKTPSKMQSLPVLKGTHGCEQKINKQGILTESTCSESHLFRPFAKANSGATTDIKTKVTFKKETTGVVTPEGPIGAELPLSFSHERTPEDLVQDRVAAENAMSELCAQTTPGVTSRAPALFGKLVSALKKLDAPTLVSLHRDINNKRFCDHAEKYLHDAIPTIGTAASARIIKDLILSGEVTGIEESLWLNSLAFVQNPSSAMLSEITPLLKTSPLRRPAALAISSLVNNYCRVNADCSTDRAVQDIVSTLGAHLVGGCRKAATEHDVVLMSLKAIGNTGHGESIADSINACIGNTDLSVEIRVAAIQAFRRMACTADRSELTRVFENAQMDSELRINAYLSLMACPTTDILRRVRSQLSNEEINQVGSFVWTHLTNLMETSSPLKQEIRQIVDTEELRKEFDMDKRKFSRNIEKSYFSEMFNSGASLESNLIWSDQSFVPRSASVNLTADLFGHSINLVEVGGRVEGINDLLDKIFDKNTPADENKDSTREINEINGKANVKRENEPKGSAYVRVFGNEISYVDFHDLDAETIRNKFNYLNWLIELAKEHSIDYTKSFQFLDTTVTVATIAGYPLRMNIQGNAVTDIKMSGKFDIRSMATAPRSLAIDGSFAPSASVEIAAEMGIDAYVTRSGLRSVDNMHTSTVADSRIILREGKIFELDIKTPRDKMEVFSVKHDFFVIYRDEPFEIPMTGGRIEYSKCIGDTFTKVTGMEVCGVIAVPNALSESNGPYFPLASSGEISLTINKKDTFSGYHFEAKALREMNDHEGHRDTVDIARVSFNTPGSRINREITMDFSINHSEKQVAMSLITPWSERAEVRGSLTNTAELKRAHAIATIGSTNYEAVAEVQIRPNAYNTRYEPKFELILPNMPNPKVSGSLLYRPSRKIDLSLSAENIFRETVLVEGSITNAKQAKKIRYETELNIKSPIVNGKVSGFMGKTDDVMSSRLEVTYKPSGGVRNRLTFSGKVRDKSAGKRTDVSGTMAFTSSAWAKYDTDLKFGVQQQGNSLSTSFEGKLAGSEQKSIKIDQTGLLALSGYNKKANLEVDFKLPYMNMDYNTKLNHEHKKDLLKSSAILSQDGRQHSVFSLDLSRESVSPLKAKADIKLHYPGRRMRYTQTIEELAKKQFTNDLALQLQEDQIIHLTADYKMQPRHELEATLTSPFTAPINFNAHLKPVLREFDVKAAVEHDGRTYAAEATLSQKAAETRAEMKLTHPRRTITSEIELKSAGKTYTGTFETKWDAARDINKKVSLNAEITLVKMRPALTLKAQAYPEHLIEIITSGEFIHRSDKCNLQGDFLFKSSIPRFEEITASFKHKKSPTQMRASAQLTFAPRKKIDTGFTINFRNGWESLDANAELTTPFAVVRKITYELDYAKESNTFRANTKGMFNRHSVGIVASGTASLPNIDGSITMTTTFPNFESVTLKGNHADTGLKCHTDAELSWAPGKKMSLNYNGEHSRSGYYLNSNADLTVTTPFKGYRTNKINLRHSNDAGSVQHHLEVEMAKQKAIFDFDASIVSTGSTREFHLKTVLNAPGVDMAVNANHEHSIRNARGVKTDISVQWAPGKTIAISQNTDFDNTGLVCLTKFTSPFEGFEAISIDLNDRLQGNTITAKNEIKWPAATISLDGNMVYQDTEFDGTFELTTPYFPKQKVTMMSKQEADRMISKRTYEYAPGKKMEVTEELGLGKIKSYSFEFKSRCPYLEQVSFNAKHDGDLRDFTNEIDFFSNLMSDKFELTTKASTSDLSEMKLNINMKTPYRPLRYLRAMYGHNVENPDVKCSGSFQIPGYKATFNHDMTAVSWNNFNTKSAIMYRPGEKIELTTRFRAAKKIIAVATLQTPFEDMEDLSFKFNHEGPWSNMKTNAEVNLDKNRKISGDFEFEMADGIRCFVTVNTPFRYYKNLGATINLGLAEKKFDWSVNVENKRIAGQNIVTLRGSRLNMRHSLQTPFRGYESMLFTFQHEGSISDFKQEGLFEYPGMKFTLMNTFAFDGRDLVANSQIKTPFNRFGSFIMDVNHRGTLRDFTNSFSVLLDGDKYDATSSLTITPSDFKLDAKVHIPQEFTFSLEHNTDLSGGINKVIVIVNEKRISAETKFLHRGNSIEGAFILLTPFEGYEKLNFDGKHTGPWNNFNCEYIFEVFGRRITVTDEFKLMRNKLAVDLNIATPFRNLRSFAMQVNHNGPLDDFKNDAVITINGMRYGAESEMKLLGTSVSGTAAVKIPEEYRITLNHAGSWNDFSNSVELKAHREVFSGESEFKFNGGHVDASATVTTPSSQPTRVIFKFDHEGTLTNFKQEAVFSYNTKTVSTKTIFEIAGNDVKATVELKTPFTAVRSFVIDANHEGKNMRNFRNNLDVILNGQKRSVSSDFRWFSTAFKFKFAASIPETYSIVIKNKGRLTDFSSSVLITTPTAEANSNCNFKLTNNDVTGSLSINTPFRHMKSQSITFEAKKVADGFTSEAKVLLDCPAIKSIEMALNHAGSMQRFNTNGNINIDGWVANFEVNHQGSISDFASSAAATVDGQTGRAQISFKKVNDKIEATSSISTPFRNYERFALTFNHNGDLTDFQTTANIETPSRNLDASYIHKGHLNNFECVASLESNGKKFDGEWKFKNTRSGIVFNADIKTPFTEYREFGVDFEHKNTNGIKTTLDVKTPFTGYENMNARFSHDGPSTDFHTVAVIDIPSRPFKIDLTHQGIRSDFNTNGYIQYGPRKYSFAKAFKYADGDLETSGSFEMPQRRYAYLLSHKDTDSKTCITKGSLETPHHSYERASFELKIKRGDGHSFETIGTIKPFQGEGSFHINHHCSGTDFTSSVDAAWNAHTVFGKVMHRGNMNEFESSAEAKLNNHRISGTINHHGNLRAFESSASAALNDDSISATINHRGHQNDFATSAEAKWNDRKFNGAVNHRGNRNAFTSAANAQWDNRRINSNVDFKNEDGNIDASATVETPFSGYERFHAIAKHNLEGKKMNTEARVETPFRNIRNPSFEIQHRGHWKNFKTSATIVTPFKTVAPVTISANHRGISKDFTSVANFEYGRDKYSGTATFKKTPTGMVASGEIETPFEEARKLAANFDYSYDGQTFNTKSQVETPHRKYDVFGIEINHEGDLKKFETSGKIDTPLTSQPILFAVNHEGRLTDFKTSGSIESAGRKIEGEASYKKSDGYYEADHDASIRIATPYERLRSADMTLKHAHKSGVWSGNLKGSYNGQNFDADYNIANKDRKAATVTIREPLPMEYTASVKPSTGEAEAFVNWDSRTSQNQMRFEAVLKNDANNYKTDRQFTLKVTCPQRTRTMTAGYTMSGDKLETNAKFQWGNSDEEKIAHEMELIKSSRGRATIYEGSFQLNSPVVTFQVLSNHQVNPNRRYLTEIKLVTSETMQFRSDIKTPKGDSREVVAAFQISHPRLSKPVVIEIDSTIEPDGTLYDGRIDLEYAEEKITFTGKIADQSNRYRTRYLVESSLKHPSNKLDVSFKSFILANKKEFKAEGTFEYLMSRTREMKTLTSKISFDKIGEEAKIEIATPVKSFEVSGRRTINDASRQHYSVSGTMDGRSAQAEIDMDKSIPGIDMTLKYAPGKTLHTYGKYLSPDHFQIKAYRQLSGKKIPEVEFDTEIVAGNLIKSRAFLRPTVVSDISDLFSTDSDLGRLYNEVTEAIADDLRLKAPGFKRAAAPVVDAMEMVANDVARIAVKAERMYNRMYSRNEYYTRDLSQAISRFFIALRAQIDTVVESTADAITHMEGWYLSAATQYDEWRRSSVHAYNQFYTEATAKLAHYRRTLQEKMDEQIIKAQSSLLDLVNYIRTHPRVQALFDRLQAKAERIVARADELIEKMYDAGKELLARPEMAYVRKYVNNANAKVSWVAEYLNLEERIHEFVHNLKQTGFGPLRRTIWRTLRDYCHFDQTKITTWAPERGEVAGQLYIPATMRDLRSFPTFKVSGYFDDLKRFIPDTNWVFWDTLYAYKPSSDIRDWIPPFKSHATISGTQHYMTFDKKFFEFAGECSYILAHDMIDNSFSVIVNYKSDGIESTKKSITVVHGKDTVEILPDFRVEVNSRRSEMPVISTHTAVYRVGNTLRIDNDHGVKIACNLPHDHCTVSVTGWYFAKTGGLLGTYDNEPSTDFKMPNGEMANSPEALASSWTVGKQCRAINRANDHHMNAQNPNYQRCMAIFKEESSSFRPCFKQVDNEAFLRMCMNGDVCKVASFYVHECGNHDVPIRMPRECVTCELPNGHRLSEGQEETLSSADSNKADVVFVISHGECNQEAVEKLEMLANQVFKGMKEIGIRNVNFGIVGYGGKGREAEPHSHTMDGQLLNTKTTFIQTIRSFRTSTGSSDEDSLAAIRFASNYPFRAGASKSVVLVPCEKCTTKKTPYSVIQEALSEKDIRFHMLVHQDFELRASSKSPKTSYMFGIDRESVYTNKDVGSTDIRGDRDLRRHTLAPKDLCVALTHESDGSVFNILKLTQTKSMGQKRFADVFSRVLAKKGTPSECQVCECRSDETGVGVSVCRSCQPPAPYVYSWDHISGLPEPEMVIPKKGRMSKRKYN